MSEFLRDLKRTHDCGALRSRDAGTRVVLFGWVASRRDHGGCVFIDLRDREGIAQIVFDPQYTRAEAWTARASSSPKDVAPGSIDAALELAEQMRSEWVIGVRGVVVSRGA